MKRLLRVLTTPVILITLFAGIFILVNVRPGSRLELFATLSTAILAGTELVNALTELFKSERDIRSLRIHSLLGVGASFMTYSLVYGMMLLPFVIGTSLFVVGNLLWQRQIRDLRSQIGVAKSGE